MVGDELMGFAWLMPDDQTCRGYFKYLPRRYLADLEHFNSVEITQIEDSLLRDNTKKHSNYTDLINLRELQKDHLLNDFILCVHQSIGNSRYLRIPDSHEIIPDTVTEFAERLLAIRKVLLKRLGE